MKLRWYRLLGHLLAPRFRHTMACRIHPDGRSLDVGCGGWSCLSAVGMSPYGVDISFERMRAFGPGVVATAILLPFADGSFDSVWSFGLLHHLPDHDARAAIREMRRVTRPGGRTVVFDGVLPRHSWRRPLAWVIRRLDHGHWMRRQEALDALLESAGAWSRERFTYSYIGLEGVFATCVPTCDPQDGR